MLSIVARITSIPSSPSWFPDGWKHKVMTAKGRLTGACLPHKGSFKTYITKWEGVGAKFPGKIITKVYGLTL